MLTKFYEKPEVDIFNFTVEAGFQDSKVAGGTGTTDFGQANLGGDEDWE